MKRLLFGVTLTGCAFLLVGLPFPAAPAPASRNGTLVGKFVLQGKAPVRKFVVKKGDKTRDAACCAQQDIPDESLVIGEKTGGIANVCIYLLDVKSVPPNLKKAAEVPFEVRGCQFRPRVLLVQVGQKVRFTSADRCSHAVIASAQASWSLARVVPAMKTERFDIPSKPHIPFVQVYCPIHPWMKAWWLVLDHPYAAISDPAGKFSIDNLPPGEHTIRIWHEKAGYLDRQRKITIRAGKTTDLGDMAVPVARFED
jgi:plastocyanin